MRSRSKPSSIIKLGRCLLTVVAALSAVDAFAKRIPIGALFDADSTQSRSAFRFEIEKNNNLPGAKFKIDKYEKIIDIDSTFQISKALCSTMSKGVFALFGLTDQTTLTTTESFGRTFNMPYITHSAPSNCSLRSPSPASASAASPPSSGGVGYTVYMRPSYEGAILAVARYYQWTHVYYLYDTDEGMYRLEQLFGLLASDGVQLDIDAYRLAKIDNCYELLRLIDQQNRSEKRVVIDLSTKVALPIVLAQILNLGMHRTGYHYVIGDLAIDEVDLSSFRFGGVNITGFRLADPTLPHVELTRRDWTKWVRLNPTTAQGADELQLDGLLAMDAVSVIIRSLSAMLDTEPEVFKNTFRRGQVYNNETRGIQCRSEPLLPWVHGRAIIQNLHEVSFEGLTGHVAFDEFGCRRDFKLDVLELNLNTEIRKIGQWDSRRGLHISRQTENGSSGRQSTANRTRIVSTILSDPYLMNKTRSDDGHTLEGNDQYQGFCADLARSIALKVGFSYELRPVKDNSYGQKKSDGTWNGMVGELTRREADLAVAPLTISSMRERVIDFSKPFMNLGISIMIKKPEKQKPGVFSFMEPLSYQIWICIVFSYLTVSLVLFLVSRFSPYEWHIDDAAEGPTFTNDFTMLNSLWFSLGAFMQQGCDISPRSVSGRLAGSSWWFFTLIIISTYTANLAAFLTVERMLTPINSVDDLAKQTQIHYGTLNSGSTKDFFRTSKIGVYEKMWSFMSSTPNVFVETTEEGVKKVRESKGKYAFILESTMNEYYNQKQPCNTMKVGDNLDSKGYGVATPIGSDLRDGIGLAVLQLRETGELQKLQKKWWFDKGECNPEADSKGGGSTQSALTLSNVAGIFYILISGLGLSMVVSLLEFICKSRSEAKKHKQTFSEFMRFKSRSFAPPPEGAPDDENEYSAASALTTPMTRTPVVTPSAPPLTRTSVV